MTPLIATFVPTWLVRRSREDPTALSSSGGVMLRGAVMLADVSGFTALAERLRAHGAEASSTTDQQ